MKPRKSQLAVEPDSIFRRREWSVETGIPQVFEASKTSSFRLLFRLLLLPPLRDGSSLQPDSQAVIRSTVKL